VVPTPAVAYLAGNMDFDLGVMISASHNPMEDNGIKFFDRSGYKLADEVEDQIEILLGEDWERPVGPAVGRMTQDPKVVEDAEMLGIVSDAFDTMAERWTRLITAAIRRGELPDDLDAHQLADTLSAVIQGGYVLSRARGSQEPMDSAVRGMVALLESAARPPRSGPPDAPTHHPHEEQP